MRKINLIETEQKIIDGIKKYVGTKNAFVGISGGIDSAVTAFLCVKALGKKKVFGVLMPYGRQSDIFDSIAVVNQLNIKYFQKDIKPIVDQYKIADNRFVKANIMSRVRMSILYAYTNHKNGLVVGTTNKSEMAVGYFTKYGDGGCDLEPIANLYKTEVIEMAKHLNIPQNIIIKKPTAGLWDDQTDESEFGFTYSDLDVFLQGGHINPEIEVKIQDLIKFSEHKRHLPPTISID
jgi:NAD+ synthase